MKLNSMLFFYWCLAFLTFWFFVPYAVRKSDVWRLRKLCRQQRAVVLTFDDGPSRSVTPKILNLLAEFNVRAMFFVIGYKVESESEVCAMVVSKGHEIGSHSYRHFNSWKKSPFAVYRDIDKGLVLVKRLSSAVWYRPPHGKITLATLLQVWMNNCRHAWWTIDSTDTWAVPKSIEAVLDEIRIQGGGVILLHDHDRPAHPEHETYVVNLTRAILEMARSEGFRVCQLSTINSV